MARSRTSLKFLLTVPVLLALAGLVLFAKPRNLGEFLFVLPWFAEPFIVPYALIVYLVLRRGKTSDTASVPRQLERTPRAWYVPSRGVWIFAALTTLLWVAGYIYSLRSWDEDVLLSDNRVITVTQKRRVESAYNGSGVGDIPREFSIKANVPGITDGAVTWHSDLSPIILNVFEGKLYLVAFPMTGLEQRRYRRLSPYFVFRYDAGTFKPVPLSELPRQIYEANLLIDMPRRGTSHVGTWVKIPPPSQYPHWLRKVDPAYHTPD